jgi:hypothetical protein
MRPRDIRYPISSLARVVQDRHLFSMLRAPSSVFSWHDVLYPDCRFHSYRETVPGLPGTRLYLRAHMAAASGTIALIYPGHIGGCKQTRAARGSS